MDEFENMTLDELIKAYTENSERIMNAPDFPVSVRERLKERECKIRDRIDILQGSKTQIEIDRTNRGCKRCHAQLMAWENVMCRQCSQELDS